MLVNYIINQSQPKREIFSLKKIYLPTPVHGSEEDYFEKEPIKSHTLSTQPLAGGGF